MVLSSGELGWRRWSTDRPPLEPAGTHCACVFTGRMWQWRRARQLRCHQRSERDGGAVTGDAVCGAPLGGDLVTVSDLWDRGLRPLRDATRVLPTEDQ